MKIVKDLTPTSDCLVSACPAIFETDKDSYVLIAKKVDSKLGIEKG